MKAKPRFSRDEITALAVQVGLKIFVQAPQWGWYLRDAFGAVKRFAVNNDEAHALLMTMKAALVSADKAKQLWHCVDPRGFKGEAPEGFVSMAACVQSKAALIRMLDAHFGCGPGTGKPGHAYRVRKFWSPNWPAGMLKMSRDVHGLWSVDANGVTQLEVSK